MELNSKSFSDEGNIPVRYTGFGEDVSPELNWEDVPEGTKSCAIIADDPDAPMGTWIHWVIYDIPASLNKLEENISREKVLSSGVKQGINSFGQIGYGGPYPPPGPAHRYVFTLYALDADLDLNTGLDKNALMKSFDGHILGETDLTGKFGR